MTSTVSPATRERRLEVERVLIDRGLLRGPRRILSPPRRPLAPGLAVAELIPALQELGPVFVALGRYLSLRGDLLAAQDCLLLEPLDDVGLALPIEAVDERLAEELGRPRTEIFAAFEATPFATGWRVQSHRARLRGGERVVVKIAHCGRPAGFAAELDALRVLAGVFSGSDSASADHFAEVLADFERYLTARLDLGGEADALQILGRDASRNDLLVVPQVYREASSAKVLTVQWLPGSTLDEIAALPNVQTVDAEDMARRIGLIWLQMALVGHRFPIEAEVIELPDGRLAVTGGVFAKLPEPSRVNLWNYVRATAGHFPDRAAASLLREVSKLRRRASAGELRTRIRQVVPFRDGGWSTTGESLGEYAISHWRLLRGAGFRPRPHLDDFYQGLFWAARSARRFAPGADPLGEALGDLDWLAGWNQFRQLTSPRQMGMTAESYMASLVELPQKLDRILGFASEEGGFRLPEAAQTADHKRRNSTAAVLSLALVMAALVLLHEQWRHLGATLGLSAAWSERALAVVFLTVGLVLLQRVRR